MQIQFVAFKQRHKEAIKNLLSQNFKFQNKIKVVKFRRLNYYIYILLNFKMLLHICKDNSNMIVYLKKSKITLQLS